METDPFQANLRWILNIFIYLEKLFIQFVDALRPSQHF